MLCDEDAELIDRSRPAYPEILFDELFRVAFLVHPSVVEIGCGTGQASVALARRSSRLTCIEAGASMATVARRNISEFPSVKVVHAPFEAWDPGGERHDLVFAAAAWHWLDPACKYEKAASVLKPGGQLAILSSEHTYPEDYDPLFDRIQDIYVEAVR